MCAVGAQEQARLQARLGRDDDVDQATVRIDTDRLLSIGADVWRLRWRGQATAAVAEDAGLHTTCGALLDALAIFEVAPAGTYDPTAVNVLIDRPLPGETPTETDQALRSLRSAVRGITARTWYRGGDRLWQEDRTPPPIWPLDNPTVNR